MTAGPLGPLGPEPFRFAPAQPGLRARAFSLPFRLLATAIVVGLALWLFALWRDGRMGTGTTSGVGWFAAALMMLAYTGWHILTSRTWIEDGAFHQSWMWHKRLELADLAFCKMVRVPGLDWLIAPRVYARTLMGKFAVFYAADAAMLAEFDRLVRELKAFRGF
ncbi:MAG: hypothetical protein EOP40_17050 [Rubrivivax sp.]|nr:MAG: hypothetical protein EOP40_17050 [Rubrivivax sp.]